jgi:DNA invertase Pin-like site-specific DNA recombinase
MTIYGYVRVSSSSQEENSSLKIQTRKLINYGVLPETVHREVGSGESFKRPVLRKLLDDSEFGDEIVVTATDRFARCTFRAIKKMEDLRGKSIKVIALDISELTVVFFFEDLHFFIKKMHH